MKEENKTRVSKNSQGYGYKYTDLAQIHEYLESKEMYYYQFVESDELGNDYIMTAPIIKGEEQKARRGVKIVDAVLQGIKNPAQEQGSATTYARRYSLLMAFGLATEDDDGASLTKPKATEKKVETKIESRATEKKVETKIESRATEKQIEMIKKLYNADFQKRALDIVKKTKLEDLTVMEASNLISQRKTEEK